MFRLLPGGLLFPVDESEVGVGPVADSISVAII